jgi:hypothetical protein
MFNAQPDRTDKARWLERLRESGVFLVDLMEHPYGGGRLEKLGEWSR